MMQDDPDIDLITRIITILGSLVITVNCELPDRLYMSFFLILHIVHIVKNKLNMIRWVNGTGKNHLSIHNLFYLVSVLLKVRGAAHSLCWRMYMWNWQPDEKGAALLKGRQTWTCRDPISSTLNSYRGVTQEESLSELISQGCITDALQAYLPQSVVTHRHPCAHSEAGSRGKQILLLELEEAAGFQRQGLGGACFPAIWGNVTPPTSQILSQGCPVLPGRKATLSSLRKDEFRYRGKGESSLLTTLVGIKIILKCFLHYLKGKYI